MIHMEDIISAMEDVQYPTFFMLECVKVQIQNLMKTGIQNLAFMILIPYTEVITTKS